jgi:hypothetical protein
MKVLATMALCTLGGVVARGRVCHDTEDVRDGQIWVVDCSGTQKTAVLPMEQGDFHYKADHQEWSSRDPRVSAIAVHLPREEPCTHDRLQVWLRCLQVPQQFAWCENRSFARFVGDQSFPTYAESLSDMARVAAICAPENATVRTLPPIRSYNAHDVRKKRERQEQRDTVLFFSMLGFVICWLICSSDCRKGRYSTISE